MELRQNVKQLWQDKQVQRRVGFEIFSQIPVAFGCVIGSYLGIMLARPHGIYAVGLLAIMAFGAIVAGGLFHDSNHHAVFRPFGLPRWLDDLLAWLTSDVLLGVNSYWWSKKHDHHHSETNILELDGDLHLEPVFRLHPSRAYQRLCRWQHLYAWGLYSLMLYPMHYKSYRAVFLRGTHGAWQLPRASWSEKLKAVCGISLFYAWALALPIWQFGWWGLVAFVSVAGVVGLVYGTAFQLAHCMPTVKYPTMADLAGKQTETYEHQLETTAGFSPNNPALRWMIGGLTHQPEHHAERMYPHPFYRFMARVVKAWCQKHDVAYNCYPTLWSALKAHGQHLKAMGLQGRPVELEMAG